MSNAQSSNGFDFNAIDQVAEAEDQGTVVHVHDQVDRPMYYTAADGSEKPVTITVAGVHSRRHRKAEEAIRRRKLKPNKLTNEVFYEDHIEKVVACTIGWEGFYSGSGESRVPVELTRQNAGRLYKSATWVLDQVVEAMNDHQRFFSTSSPTPSHT